MVKHLILNNTIMKSMKSLKFLIFNGHLLISFVMKIVFVRVFVSKQFKSLFQVRISANELFYYFFITLFRKNR